MPTTRSIAVYHIRQSMNVNKRDIEVSFTTVYTMSEVYNESTCTLKTTEKSKRRKVKISL